MHSSKKADHGHLQLRGLYAVKVIDLNSINTENRTEKTMVVLEFLLNIFMCDNYFKGTQTFQSHSLYFRKIKTNW